MKIQRLDGLNGNNKTPLSVAYYSEEAANAPQAKYFVRGLDYYEREPMMINGLGGLSGLGFLRKITGAINLLKSSPGVKKLLKPVKRILTTKKDGSTRNWVTNHNERRDQRALTQTMEPIGMTSTMAVPSNIPLAPMTPVAQAMPTVAQAIADPMPNVDSILNIVKSFTPDDSLMREIIEARTAANLSQPEAQQIATQAAEKQKAEVMAEVYKMKAEESQAGFGLNNMMSNPLVLILAAAGITYAVTRKNNAA